MPADTESLVRLSNTTLASSNLEPTILFFDALNQVSLHYMLYAIFLWSVKANN